MYKYYLLFLIFYLVNLHSTIFPDITFEDIPTKTQEVLKVHATFKKLSPELMERIVERYLHLLDPNKTYFLSSELTPFLEKNSSNFETMVKQYEKGDFSTFIKIHSLFGQAIERKRKIEEEIDNKNLPTGVRATEFKDSPWAISEQALREKIARIRSLQFDTIQKLDLDLRTTAVQSLAKRQKHTEDIILQADSREKEKQIACYILKSFANALDSHTAYFTPNEATQFIINVQQRLYGIGAQLRDDLNGFTIIKIVEGGPAHRNGHLNEKDRIIAVNGEPVVGMEIEDAVNLIRGENGTEVTLRIIREKGQKEEQLDIAVVRGEVIIEDARYESSYTPYGDGVIGYLKLHSFYQDEGFSSAEDLTQAILALHNEHVVHGLILDLRDNSGGLLSQAVEVAGLFMKPGIVVSIKDEKGRIQHLRSLNPNPLWNGPLIVLINRFSASASEIVAQTLQEYGRALVVGDPQSFGKGSYQTFTLNASEQEVNPKGEFKVTRGCYYTVKGDTPQGSGLKSDLKILGPYSQAEIGESFTDYPLKGDHIPSNFIDAFADVSPFQREQIREVYQINYQEQDPTYTYYLPRLTSNSSNRLKENTNYQRLMEQLKIDPNQEDEETVLNIGQTDLQLEETYAVMKDLLFMLYSSQHHAPQPTRPILTTTK